MQGAARKIERAQRLHQAGRWQEAEGLYLEALEQSPGEAEGLHLLGLLHAETGRPDTAVQLLRAAIGLEGPAPHLCRNLGILLERQNQPEAAVACYRQALAGQPEESGLWVRVAELLGGLGRFGEAAEAWHSAAKSRPDADRERVGWLVARAQNLALAGEHEQARVELASILQTHPQETAARYTLGVVFMHLDRIGPAVEAFAQVVAEDPAHADAQNNLGVLRQSLGETARARQHYAASLAVRPESIGARYNLGTLLQETGEIAAAMAELRQVLTRDPEHAGAWTNLGSCLLGQGDLEGAVRCAGRALTLDPTEPSAVWNAGLAHLTAGRLTEGWRGYEARFQIPGAFPRRPFAMPLWKGEPVVGRTILVYAEQGLGDTLQFCRYLPLLSAQGARVIFECPPKLQPLLETLDPRPELVPAPADPAPVADYHVPLLSVPGLVGTTIGTIPCAPRYLAGPEAARERWRTRLAPLRPRRLVGFVSQGNPKYKNDRNRSTGFGAWEPVGLLPGVALVHLQYGVAAPPALVALDLGPEVGDFADTAGLVEELDLVITVDTSMVHLAGALGKPAWLLLPYAADWRWLQNRSDSPWYPSVRIFRQPRPGDWTAVMAEVATALGGVARDGRCM